MEISLHQASEDDIPTLYDLYEALGKKDEGFFEAVFEKDCLILIASLPLNVIPAVSGANINSGDPGKTAAKRLTSGSRSRECPYGHANGMTGGVNVGFGILNFEPKYKFYQKFEIPEIQDLNVLPDYREQGIGTKIIEALENIARDQGAEQIGISVGLTADYGAAQYLYAKLGYIPDGQGVTCDRQMITKGDSLPIDDNLALMMVKDL